MKRRPAVQRCGDSVRERSSRKPNRCEGSNSRLAATVAHEINNPLMSILLAAERLALDGSLGPETFEQIRAIREAAIHIRDIVEKLQRLRSDRAKEYLPGIQMLDVNGES